MCRGSPPKDSQREQPDPQVCSASARGLAQGLKFVNFVGAECDARRHRVVLLVVCRQDVLLDRWRREMNSVKTKVKEKPSAAGFVT